MKSASKMNFVNVITFLIICVFSFQKANSQEKTKEELSKFHISVEYDRDNKISMVCDSACAWKTLSFFRDGKVLDQAVDEFGMTQIGESSQDSKFLFTFSQTKNGFAFVGLKGTAFTNLAFTLKPYRQRFITATGMSKN